MNNDKPTYQDLELKIKELELENFSLKTKQVEINKAKELYLKIFDDFPALIWRSRVDKLCDYFNKTWFDFTGRTMKQEFGTGWAEGVHPDDFSSCLEIYTKAFDRHEPFEMDYRLKNKLGEYRWIKDFGRPFYDLDDTFLGYIGSCYDISEIKEKELELIQAKEQIKESDERYNLAMNATKDGIFDWNLVTNEIYYSPHWKMMLGYKDNELPNDFSIWENLTNKEDAIKSWEMQQELINKHRDRFEMEFKMKHKDGHWVDILSRADAVFDEKGKAVRIVGTHVDISARKQMEKELIVAKEKAEENEEKFKTIFNMSQSLICIADINTSIFKFINPTFEKILGHSEQELLSKPFFDFIHPDDLQPTIEVIENQLQLGIAVQTFENRYLCKNGNYCWLNWNSFPVPEKGITYAIAHDVTELKKNERNLKDKNEEYEAINEEFKQTNEELFIAKEKSEENEKKYRALYNNAPLSYQSLDSEGRFLDINPMWSKTLGYDRHEVIGAKFEDFLHPDHIDHFNSNFPLFKKQGCVSDVQFKFKRKDGSFIHVSFEGCASYTSEGEFKRTYCVFKDITEQKAIEKDLIKSKEKAEESDRLKTEFINNMSHEIRTPMNGILGFSKLLEKTNKSDEKRKNYVSIIQNSGNQLMRIIDDILEISKLGTKQVGIVEKEICLNDMLLELFSIFDIKAKENKTPLYLKKGLTDKESIILSDETKLNKILSNLLENALKFTNEGFIEFGYNLVEAINESTIQIYVKDTGIGIRPEKYGMIFERFSQEEKELSKNVGGLGLGLSIAKENAELLGGKITVQSVKAKGSTFCVEIPYKPSNTKINNLGNNKDEIIEKQDIYSILIVEDEEVNYLFLETLLEDEIEINCEIFHAKNGKEAVDLCKGNLDIHLVLMDLKMPIMNGFEAAKLIKSLRPNLPIVAQTAYSTDDDKERAFTAGCDDFISKPISEEKLNEIMKKYLIAK